jgi:hypothetical protein
VIDRVDATVRLGRYWDTFRQKNDSKRSLPDASDADSAR